MDVSVIIASGRKDAAETIDSLLNRKCDASFEIILAHDASNPPGKKIDGVRYIECDTTNPARKRNAAAAVARGEVLAFIDDDATAPPDWLERGLETLREHPYTAGCGGPNLPPEDQNDAEKITDAVLSSKLGSGSGSYAGGGEIHVARVGEIHLVNFFIKKNVFETTGGLNETLGYGSEDSEFIYVCRRLSGADFIFDPALKVIHRRRSFGKDFFSQRFKLRRQNGRLLWTRPGMYVTKKRSLFLAALAIILVAGVSYPIFWIGGVIGYLVLLARGAKSVGNGGGLRWVAAVASLHAVSAAGILSGLADIPTRDKYSGLLRRPGR